MLIFLRYPGNFYISPQNIRISIRISYLFFRYFSKEPHLAGSKRNNDLAQHIVKKWKEYGFDQVELAKYDVLMTSTRKDLKSKVEIYCHGQVVFTSQSHEKV